MTDQQYRKALDFMFAQLPMFSRIGAAAYKPGLDTSINLDNYFGNPHRRYKTIHVAGTNGKGSTSHMLAAMLQAAGYKVGLYTSPHLKDFRERMRVNGIMIPKEDVVNFVERWHTCGYEGHPSFFELTMMMAFDWFAREQVDIAVIEVGMGGRLDSTNIITPICCVITNISPDHMQFLGDTLPKIAAEKAGVIKKGIPVVIGEAEGEIREVFSRKAADVGAPITFAEDSPYMTGCVENELGGWDFSARNIGTGSEDSLKTGLSETESVKPLHAELCGDYQKKNINTVLAAVDMLRSLGITLDDVAVRRGFAEVGEMTGLAGRWMVLEHDPEVVCDTGHNIAGLGQTMPQLERLRRRKGGKARLVMGFVSDKDVANIVHLLPRDGIYYVTQAAIPRAMEASRLHEILTSEGLNAVLCEGGVKKAFVRAKAEAAPDDVIYIGGSTFVVADMLAD